MVSKGECDMPFRSKAQRRWMYAAEARGEVEKGTAKRWEDETKDKDLPEKVAAMELMLKASTIII
jgi:hypothetical protein